MLSYNETKMKIMKELQTNTSVSPDTLEVFEAWKDDRHRLRKEIQKMKNPSKAKAVLWPGINLNIMK